MILPAQTLRLIKPVSPFMERTISNGMTFGVGPAGYDIRIAENLCIPPGGFSLASSVEHFDMPADLLAYVKDKSTWARQGLCVQNTVIEPGWRGFLTLELTNHTSGEIAVRAFDPIAQIIFHRLEAPTDSAYAGKYQDQEAGAQAALLECAA